MDILDWIDRSLNPRLCTSAEFMYDDMDSQSGHSLPVIYQPFDADQRSHWRDRGALFDYLSSTGGGELLDFGPGDGWPSLIVAPFAQHVVGVDGSRRRVAVCTENATRLGLSNVEFIYVEPGMPLPFPDGYFDGIMAASSIEQTPDPKATLQELFRVLRPGGRLRVSYEALSRYRDDEEREAWLWEVDDHTRLVLVDRDIDGERARQYRLTFALSSREIEESLPSEEGSQLFEAVTVPIMEQLQPFVVEALRCPLTHPSGRTLASWLSEVGFREVLPSHSGAWFAGRLFDALPEARRPVDMRGVDEMLRPVVQIAVHMAAPLDADPMITAIR